MIKILSIYEDFDNYKNEFKILNFKEKTAENIIIKLKLRARYSAGRERYFLITDEVLKHCKKEDEIFGLYKTLSEKRKKLFFIEL